MFDISTFVLGAGAGASVTAAALAPVLYRAWRLHVAENERRLALRVAGILADIRDTKLQAELDTAQPIVQHRNVEAMLFEMTELRTRLETIQQKAKHVLAGGRYDDPPDKYAKGKP